MGSNFIINFWPVWIAGLIILPLLIILTQLKNIRFAIDQSEENPKEVAKLFLSPGSLIITIVFGLGTFVCFVLFMASVLVGTVAAIKALF